MVLTRKYVIATYFAVTKASVESVKYACALLLSNYWDLDPVPGETLQLRKTLSRLVGLYEVPTCK